jgi:dTMP kinase
MGGGVTGSLIVLEGPDGVGKSTQVERLSTRLRALGYPVVVVREPGGTPVGEEIRRILLDSAHEMEAVTEMLLFAAARAELVGRVVRPALQAGQVVVMDRYVLSSLAYQGYGLGLDLDAVRAVNRVATGGLAPDVTIVLWGEGIRPPAPDRLERRPAHFHERVRAGYQVLAGESSSIHLVPADGPVDAIERRILSIVQPVLETKEARR